MRRQRQKKIKDRRPILKKLCAALLQLFKGQLGKEIKGSTWGNWDPREGQQPFQPNPMGLGTAPPH